MRFTTIGTITLSLTFAGVGCGSEPPKEETAKTREAICSGGGGGGDACTTSGYCPPECSTCFSSVSERLSLQNLWNCEPGGGGGGGGGATCTRGSRNISKTAGRRVELGWTGLEFCGEAQSAGAQECMGLGDAQCRPSPANDGIAEFGCDALDPDGLRYCYCTTRTSCSFSSR